MAVPEVVAVGRGTSVAAGSLLGAAGGWNSAAGRQDSCRLGTAGTGIRRVGSVTR